MRALPQRLELCQERIQDAVRVKDELKLRPGARHINTKGSKGGRALALARASRDMLETLVADCSEAAKIQT